MALSSFFAVDPVLFAGAGRRWGLPLLGRREHAGPRPASPTRSWATSSGSGRSSTPPGRQASTAATTLGETWTRLSRHSRAPAAADVPAGAGRGPRGLPRHGPGLFHTSDAGEHWEPVGLRGAGGPHRRHLPAARARAWRAAGEVHQGPRPGQRLHPRGRGRRPARTRSTWARRLCDRHRGIGGDGVVLHAPAPDGIRFVLVNADGLARRDLRQRPALPRRPRGARGLGAGEARRRNRGRPPAGRGGAGRRRDLPHRHRTSASPASRSTPGPHGPRSPARAGDRAPGRRGRPDACR